MKLRSALMVMTVLFMGLMSAGVQGLPASEYKSHPSDGTVDIFISGSSSQDAVFERWVRSTCLRDSLDIYRAGQNQKVFFCRINGNGCRSVYIGQWIYTICDSGSVPGFPNSGYGGDGVKVAIHKTSVGGSGNGVQPVANQAGLYFIDMNAIKQGYITCATTNTIQTEIVPGANFAGYTEHTGCGSVSGTRVAVPDAGISDVEPELLGASTAEISRLNMQSQNAVIFGIPVTEALRNALQEAQGLTVGAEDEANMPSLSKAQLSSIFSSGITDWNQLVSGNGTGLPDAVSTPPSDSQVYVCRRVSTSGTQAAFETYMLRQRCMAGVASFISGNDGGVVGSGTVNEGSGDGDMITCLNSHDAANRWAVGMLSTEKMEVNSTSAVNDGNVWRFIKINEYAPTLLNVANGKYDFFVEQSIQGRNTSSGNALSGLTLILMQDFTSEVGMPSVIHALNNGFRHSWGDGGVMALITNGHVPTQPTPGAPLTEDTVRLNPVLVSTHSPLGYTNNCQPPVIFFPTDGSTRY